MLISLILVSVVVVYALFIMGMDRANGGTPSAEPKAVPPSISIIVPVKDEMALIPYLYHALEMQLCCTSAELIFVNDHSTDGSREWLGANAVHSAVRIIDLEKGEEGKRAALHKAARMAGGEVLLFIDADVEPSECWLDEWTAKLQSTDADIWLGEVRKLPAKNFFERMVGFEWRSIMYVSRTMALSGVPVWANGAHMAVRRDSYLEFAEAGIGEAYPGSDDLFLIQWAYDHGKKVTAIWGDNGYVSIEMPQNIVQWWLQRLRWGGKCGTYQTRASVFLTSIIYFGNLAFVLIPFLAPSYWPVMLLKVLADAYASAGMNRKGSWRDVPAFLGLTLWYPLAFTVLGPMSQAFNMRWKGRPILDRF